MHELQNKNILCINPFNEGKISEIKTTEIEEIKNRLKQPPKFEEHEGGMTVNQLKDIIDSLVRTGFGDNVVKLDVNEYFKNLTTVQVGTGDYKGQIHLL